MKHVLSCGAAAAFYLFAGISWAATPVSIKTWLGDNPHGTVVSGDYLLVAKSERGLEIYDIARDPTRPRLVSQLTTGRRAQQVIADGDRAFVLEVGGFSIVSWADPANPSVIGGFSTPGRGCRDAFRDGTLVYASCGQLVIVDVSAPTAPVLVKEIASPVAEHRYRAAAKHGAYVYGLRDLGSTGNGTSHVDVIDARTPASARIVAQNVVQGQSGQDLRIVGNVLFYASSDALTTWEVTNPVRPRALQSFPLDIHHGPGRILQVGNRLYVSKWQRGFDLYDISDPSAVTKVKSVDLYPNALGSLSISGQYLYASDYFEGVRVFDVSNLDAPDLIWTHPTTTSPARVLAKDPFLIAVSEAGVSVIDASASDKPFFLASAPPLSRVFADDAVLFGDFVYASWPPELGIFDISDAHAPRLVNSINDVVLTEPRSSERLAIFSHYLWRTNASGGSTKIYDVADPIRPREVRSLQDDRDRATSVDFTPSHAFIGHRGGVTVYSLANPRNPSKIGSIDTADVLDVKVAGHYLLVSALRYGFLIYDIADPTTPKLIDYYSDPLRFDIRVAHDPSWDNEHPVPPVGASWGRLTRPKINVVGDVVYLTGPNLHIIDIADPEYPRFHSSWNQAGLRSMAVVNGTAYFGGINGVFGMSGLPVTP